MVAPGMEKVLLDWADDNGFGHEIMIQVNKFE
jgi:hypothetical protein